MKRFLLVLTLLPFPALPAGQEVKPDLDVNALLSRAAEKLGHCHYEKVEEHAFDKHGREKKKKEESDQDENDTIKRLSIPRLFRLNRFHVAVKGYGSTAAGTPTVTLTLSPKEKDQLEPAENETGPIDKGINRVMNQLSGTVTIDVTKEALLSFVVDSPKGEEVSLYHVFTLKWLHLSYLETTNRLEYGIKFWRVNLPFAEWNTHRTGTMAFLCAVR